MPSFPKKGDAGKSWNNRLQQLQTFATLFDVQISDSRDVSPRLGEARNQPETYRIADDRRDDRNRRRGLLRCDSGFRSRRNDGFCFETDEFLCKIGKAFDLPIRTSGLEADTLAFGVPKLTQPFPKSLPKMTVGEK
jgi:hypothetical protein